MRLKTQRRVIYAAMGLTVLSLVGGFALANLSLGGSSNASQQGSHTTTVAQVTGLSWSATQLSVSSGVGATCQTQGTPCNVSLSSNVTCAGGLSVSLTCGSSDFVEQVVLNTTAGTAMTGTIGITVFIVSGGNPYSGSTAYYYDYSATGHTNSKQFVTIDFDIGTQTTGPASVSDVTVVASTG